MFQQEKCNCHLIVLKTKMEDYNGNLKVKNYLLKFKKYFLNLSLELG